MPEFSVVPVPIYQDNYVWLLLADNETWVVDPGDHQPVIAALDNLGRKPTAVLITHHHWDHITGIVPLLNHYGDTSAIPVYGPRSSHIPGVNQAVDEGKVLTMAGLHVEVWATPGHTNDHVSYYVPQMQSLFCGDTLFSLGCGRLFDGAMEQLYASLQRIAQLPPQTLIYCTHEYTLANAEFARLVEPTNPALLRRIEQAEQLRAQNQPTLPTTLAAELQANPFLRIHEAVVRESVKKATAVNKDDDFLIFAELRMWKNRQ